MEDSENRIALPSLVASKISFSPCVIPVAAAGQGPPVKGGWERCTHVHRHVWMYVRISEVGGATVWATTLEP